MKIKQRLAMLLAMLLTLSCCPVTALATEAAEIVGEGTCGSDLEWTFDETGLLRVTGTGAMDDYTADEPAPWDYCKRGITRVAIDNGVTSVGDYAFNNCTGMMWLDLPQSLTSIGSYAFQNCSDLQELKLPENLTDIGEYAFFMCTGITGELVIPGWIESIPAGAFGGLEAVTSVFIGENVRLIHCPADVTSAFFSMEGVRELTFEGLLVPVAADPFDYMLDLETVYVPGAALTVYEHNFAGVLPEGAKLVPISDEENILVEGTCGEDMTWVLDGDGLLTIEGTGKMADYSDTAAAPWHAYADQLLSLKIGEGVTHIGKYAFYDCTELVGVSLPQSATYIGDYAFYGCAKLAALTLPEELFWLGQYAFGNCYSIQGELKIPGLVGNLGEGVFGGLMNLESLVIGSGILSICTEQNWAHSFYGMDAVREVTFEGPVLAATGNIFFYMPALETVYVPAAYYTDYEAYFADMLPEGVELKTIGGEIVVPDGFTVENGVLTAYTGSDSEVTVPYGVTAIGDLAFYCNRRVMKINLPSTVKRIGHDAFAACYSLQEINLPEGLTEIDHHAFSDCYALTGLTLPSTLTSIGEYAFFNCNKAAGELVIPDSVTSIGASAFSGCKALTKVTLPKDLTVIDAFTFNGCTALTEAAIPDSVTTIGEYAFAYCSSLQTIDLPARLTTLGNDAFQNCTAATGEVVIPDGVDEIPMRAFAGASGIESLVIGAGVERIYSAQSNAHAFYDLNVVTKVTFTGLTVPNNAPNSNEYNKDLFTYMPALKTVYVPAAAYANYEAAYGEDLPAGVALVAVGGMGNNVAQGACGEDLTWVLDADGVLTISGTGDMKDYAFGDEALWIAHKDRIKALVLEEGITSIGNHAFEGCTGLTEVHIPVGVTGIGEYAFFGCSGLQDLYFYDETPPTLGENAFGSTGLTTVYVPPTRYTLYKSTISEKLPEGITFKGLPTVEPEPQGPACTIGTAEATVSGEELSDYINKGVLLLMAAYNSEGRLLGVADTVVTNANGGYMTIEAEGIAEVRLFVTDWSFVPVKAPYVFEK